MVVQVWVWVMQDFWASGVERERGRITGKIFKNLLLPCLCICRGEEAAPCRSKRHRAIFFFHSFKKRKTKFRSDPKLGYDNGSQVVKPKPSFVLDKNAQLLVYQWLKSLRFPNGRASNISRLVNLKDCKLYGMKTHDCHVFMQTLIILAYRDLFPKGI